MISTHTNLCAVEAIVRLWRSGRMPAEQAWAAIRGFTGSEVEDRVAAGFADLHGRPEDDGTSRTCCDGAHLEYTHRGWVALQRATARVAEEAAGGPHSPSANNKTRVPGI